MYFLLGEAIEDSRHFGWQVEEKTKHDWGTMVQAIQDHVRSLNWGYKVQLRSKQVKYYNKLAQLLDKNTIKLTASNGKEETVTARNIVLAPGGRPFYPDVEGAKECCITRYHITIHLNCSWKKSKELPFLLMASIFSDSFVVVRVWKHF